METELPPQESEGKKQKQTNCCLEAPFFFDLCSPSSTEHGCLAGGDVSHHRVHFINVRQDI